MKADNKLLVNGVPSSFLAFFVCSGCSVCVFYFFVKARFIPLVQILPSSWCDNSFSSNLSKRGFKYLCVKIILRKMKNLNGVSDQILRKNNHYYCSFQPNNWIFRLDPTLTYKSCINCQKISLFPLLLHEHMYL